MGSIEVRQGAKGLTKERGGHADAKHFIVKNDCNSYERGAQTGMDQKINGRTDGS